ncbi:unnamed protein product [Vicia faba]|uniref:Transmembrane protein n=1 Tax=Vicia faba TaxID=3906 RepID=A0AAV0Z0M1_VICFA|nr:unnamed protein product [Vicia faba]
MHIPQNPQKSKLLKEPKNGVRLLEQHEESFKNLLSAMAANRFSTIVAMLLVVSVALASLPPPPPGTFASAPYQDVFDETNNTNRNSPKSIPTWVTGVGLGAVFMGVLSCAYLRPPLAAGSVLGEPVSLQLVRARAAP